MPSLWVSLAQQHDPRLLCLAGASSALACFAMFNLVARAMVEPRARLLIWLSVSILFTVGIRAAQFAAAGAYTGQGNGSSPLFVVSDAWAWLVIGAVIGFGAYIVSRGRFWGAASCGVFLAGGLVGSSVAGLRAVMDPAGLGVVDSWACGRVLAATGIFSVLAMSRLRHATFVQRLEASIYLTIAVAVSYLGVLIEGCVMPHAPVMPAVGMGNALALAPAVLTMGLTATAIALLGELTEQSLSRRVRQESRRMLEIVGAGFEGLLIHRNGIVLEASEEFHRFGGWAGGVLAGRAVTDLIAADDRGRASDLLLGAAESTSPVTLDLVASDGTTRPVELVSYPIRYDVAGEATVIGVRDLSARMLAAERIRHLAHHDALTGLPNRFLLNDRLTQALSIAHRAGTEVAVFFLDLDRFKPVNDLLGHEAGDSLLIEVGRRLRDVLRATDTPARLGGDEFAIVQPLVQNPNEAAALAQRIVSAISVPFVVAGQLVEVGVSIGIALSQQSGGTVAELLRNADTAMYRAKQEGRGGFLFFERVMDEQLQQRRFLENDLRTALARGEFELHYQPLFDTKTVKVTGFEALIRWHHPVRGMISPGQFIPLAEECGMIESIGRWVLEQACHDAASWERPHLVAVNLSPAQFRRNDLLEQVSSALSASGLPASRLELEVTEGVLIDNTRRAREVLDGLKALGVNISLDDFGTGYSSLSYLRRFPFDKIKIDKAFVSGLGQDDDAAAIVRAIVALGHSMKLIVTAEGVETEAQLQALDALNCNQIQGFLLGRPTPKAGLPFYFARYAAQPAGAGPLLSLVPMAASA